MHSIEIFVCMSSAANGEAGGWSSNHIAYMHVYTYVP